MSLKKAYLYLVSVISLIIAVVGAIMILNLALRTWVFPNADRLDYYSGICSSAVKPAFPEGKEIECTKDQIAKEKQRAEERRSARKQRDAAQALAMLIVATPVWWGHWRLAKKEQ